MYALEQHTTTINPSKDRKMYLFDFNYHEDVNLFRQIQHRHINICNAERRFVQTLPTLMCNIFCTITIVDFFFACWAFIIM